MQFFYWNSSFELGITQIDTQHRRLVDLVNELASAITEGGRLPQVEALVGELRDYAAFHFADEERLMDTAPLSEGEKLRHRGAHRGFVEKVDEISRRSDLLRADVSEQVLEFLVTWLVSHILGTDRKIARALGVDTSVPTVSHLPAEVPVVEQLLINALGETERRFRLISDYAPALIWVCDRTGARTYVNRAWHDFVGPDEAGAPDEDWLHHVHDEDRARYRGMLDDLLVSPRPTEIEYRLRRADGDHGWVLERIRPRLDAAGAFLGLIASAIDVTAIKHSEEVLARANRELEDEVARRTADLERLMRTDPLTGIGNRRLLLEHLERATERAARDRAPLVAIFVDLDHFKTINDRHGHPIGDKALVRVAGALRANLCRDGIVCRYGGEEFVAVLENTSLGEGLAAAERMRAAIARIRVAEIDGPLTASAGLAAWSPGSSIDAFLAAADRALYRAKSGGRDRCEIEMLETAA